MRFISQNRGKVVPTRSSAGSGTAAVNAGFVRAVRSQPRKVRRYLLGGVSGIVWYKGREGKRIGYRMAMSDVFAW